MNWKEHKENKKKVSVAPPLPRTIKTASLLFTDGDVEGQFKLDLVLGPDNLYDPMSLAHVHAYKSKKIVEAFLEQLADFRQVIREGEIESTLDPAAQAHESTEMDQEANVPLTPWLVH